MELKCCNSLTSASLFSCLYKSFSTTQNQITSIDNNSPFQKHILNYLGYVFVCVLKGHLIIKLVKGGREVSELKVDTYMAWSVKSETCHTMVAEDVP